MGESEPSNCCSAKSYLNRGSQHQKTTRGITLDGPKDRRMTFEI